MSSRHPGAVPAYFRQRIERHFDTQGQAEKGRTWLASIPDRLAYYAGSWDLVIGPPFDGLSYNYVSPATRADGTPAVLKLGIPEPEQRSEIRALEHFQGRGIARLLESDPEGLACLIERLIPGTMLSNHFPGRDDEATGIAARVLGALRSPLSANVNGLGTVEGWARRGMAGLREEFDGGTGPFPAALVERAERQFDELIASTGQARLLHGDFHHMNVLYSDARGWLAIDPKGVIGDAAFDCAAFLLNPIPEVYSHEDYRRLSARRIDIFSEVLGLDRQRVLAWAQAFAVLSAWWSYDEIGSWKPTIALAGELAALSRG